MSKLVFLAGKIILVATSSAIAVPYSVALAANLLYGWPDDEDKYKRALAPRKVLSLNCSLFNTLIDNFKTTKYKRKAMHFYKMAASNRLERNLIYGSNSNCLDLYFPAFCRTGPNNPVVVYLYGNNWCQISKEEHSTVCANLADSLNVIICCPNYSAFPKGYIDDMIQDVTDCLNWLCLYGEQYGIDKNKIILLGQESGAHLCTMTVLELTLKRLLYDPSSLALTEHMGASSFEVITDAVNQTRDASLNSNNSPVEDRTFLEDLSFQSKYFSESSEGSNIELNENNKEAHITKSTLEMIDNAAGNPVVSSHVHPFDKSNFTSCDSSFIILHENGNGKLSSEESNKLLMTVEDLSICEDESMIEDQSIDNSSDEKGDTKKDSELDNTEGKSPKKTDSGILCDTSSTKMMHISDESAANDLSKNISSDQSKRDSIDHSKNGSIDPIEYVGETSRVIKELKSSQIECNDVLKGIKGIVGVSGIYNISDHYDYEYHCGVEDIMVTSKVMYSKENFDRFSPTEIIPNLPSNTRLPSFSLIYGRKDSKTPSVSSEKMEFVLKGNDGGRVNSLCIPFADHLDITYSILDDSYNDLIKAIQQDILLFIND